MVILRRVMKLATHYSHFNGLEWLVYHHPNYWDEIKEVIATVDADMQRVRNSARDGHFKRGLLRAKRGQSFCRRLNKLDVSQRPPPIF
mgnify:CR=1 FL=1